MDTVSLYLLSKKSPWLYKFYSKDKFVCEKRKENSLFNSCNKQLNTCSIKFERTWYTGTLLPK